MVYGLSGLLAGVAGVFASARTGAADPNYIGVLFEPDAIAAAVIGGNPLSGGRISILGCVFGALVGLVDGLLIAVIIQSILSSLRRGA
ncbi:MAG: hypothetical protein PF501_08795 [Salinisphaera sp.]|jgi:ribose/xylose/arabinose/galactoside ABC-type transport system permease subunit|nr:hypothetical protein [Salinisphaera sp.]